MDLVLPVISKKDLQKPVGDSPYLILGEAGVWQLSNVDLARLDVSLLGSQLLPL
jgi:hypothetical protein